MGVYKMRASVKYQWPMECFIEAWKLFRDVSNENQETANHLLLRPFWPSIDDYNILDIGCGDGLLLKQILRRSKRRMGQVCLIDPDEELMHQALLNLEHIGIVKYQISHKLSKIEDEIPECFQNIHVILAVHIVYLLPTESFNSLLKELPVQIPLYVVLDNKDSIFSTLWKRTAPKYYDRAIAAHEIIKQLPRDKYKVSKTSITSSLDNPLSCVPERPDLKDAIMSILCYTDVRDRPHQEIHYIENEIRRFVVGNTLRCCSDCYEIIRKS